MSRGFTITLCAVLAAGIAGLHLVIKKPPDERYVAAASRTHDTSAAWLGAFPPDFEAPLLDGGSFRLSDAVGSKLLILNFFATWCGPCRAEIPELVRYAEAHADEVLVVGIDVKEQSDDVQRLVLSSRITYPVALDSDGLTGGLYEVAALPTTVVVGRDGRVLLYERGGISNADVAFDALLGRQGRFDHGETPITPEEFRVAVAEAGHPSGRPTGEVVLQGRALVLARRIRCPSCGKNVLQCRGSSGRVLRRRLRELDVDAMTDDEVLAALFLVPEKTP